MILLGMLSIFKMRILVNQVITGLAKSFGITLAIYLGGNTIIPTASKLFPMYLAEPDRRKYHDSSHLDHRRLCQGMPTLNLHFLIFSFVES